MARVPDWPERLAAYIEANRETPFEWGVHDCCRFAAGAVEAMTGVDRMAAFNYRNEIGATRLIQKAGGLDVLLQRTLGDPYPSLAQARRGDVVLADFDVGPTVGIVLGYNAAFAGASGGAVYLPTHKARLAWRID